MSGQRGMTGKPLYLKCSRCKRTRDSGGTAKAGKLYRTGYTRPYEPRGAKGRTSTVAYECKCKDCGHIGWYAHADAARLQLHADGGSVIPAAQVDFEPGFLEALDGLKRLKKRADRHNDCNGGMRLWSMQILILVDCAMSLLDRFDQAEARTELVKQFRYFNKQQGVTQ